MKDFICACAEAVGALFITFESWCHTDNGIVLRVNNTIGSVTSRFEGYAKSPDGFGTGTYEILHPKGASIEITRSLFEGDVLRITSVRNTPDPALEKARGIRFYDGNKKLFDGYLRAPDYRRGSNKYRTLTTGVYDWRKVIVSLSSIRNGVYYGPRTNWKIQRQTQHHL